MKAIHILDTGPYFAKNPAAQNYTAEKFDIFCAVLSALSWRRCGGTIRLCTDAAGLDFINRVGLSRVWDECGEDIYASDMQKLGIDPTMFWAASKLFMLQKTEAPVAVIDMDFIVWEMPRLSTRAGAPIVCAHCEDITDYVYPPVSYFKMKPGYEFRSQFNYSALPCNTAFLYIADESFKHFYVASAIEFMRQAEKCDDNLRYMVYAEQRMLAMCADYLAYPVRYLLDKDKLFFPQDKYTHLWGAKQAMREDAGELVRFCMKCRSRIVTDFPEYVEIPGKIDRFYESLAMSKS